MPVDWTQPIQCAKRMDRKSVIDRPTRVASDQTILCVVPRSCIMKYSAEAMLPMIRTKAIGTRICMVCYLWRSEAHLERANQEPIIGSAHEHTRDVMPHSSFMCRPGRSLMR